MRPYLRESEGRKEEGGREEKEERKDRKERKGKGREGKEGGEKRRDRSQVSLVVDFGNYCTRISLLCAQ